MEVTLGGAVFYVVILVAIVISLIINKIVNGKFLG